MLGHVETAAPSRDFYSALCRVVCRMAAMERAAIWLYDMGSHRVEVAGAHGVDLDELRAIDATIENTPVARRALFEDRVIEVSERIEEEVPVEFARMLGLTTLTCTPIAAAGSYYGVLLADRGGGRFELVDLERNILRLIGKVVALAAGARIAGRQQERARRLADRLNLTREIHEGVVQRLFGVGLALESGRDLGQAERERCAGEVTAALADLRTALQRPLAVAPRSSTATLRRSVERLPHQRPRLPTSVRWREGLAVPEELEPLAVAVLNEAIRNIRKHARPTTVEIAIDEREGALVLEVVNDGAPTAVRGTSSGMGLRLASLEAVQRGGVLDYGEHEGRFRVCLVVPMDDDL